MTGAPVPGRTHESTRTGRDMGHYKSNLRDIEFNLFEVLGRDAGARHRPVRRRRRRRPRARSWPRSTGSRARTSPRRSTRPTATRRSSTRRPTRRRCPSRSRSATSAWMDAEYWRLATLAELGGTPVPSSFGWAVGEMVLGANPAVWMYGAGAGVRRRDLPQRQRARQEDRPAHGRPAAGADHDGAHRAGRRLRRRRRPHQGHRPTRRHLAHRGRQALHHLGRGRPLRQHHPPGPGAPAGRRGRRWPGHQGPVLFIVPKFHFDRRDRRSTGERNGVYVTDVEKKMGIKVSTTCELTFGDPGRRRRAGQGLAASARCTTASRRCSRSSSTPG